MTKRMVVVLDVQDSQLRYGESEWTAWDHLDDLLSSHDEYSYDASVVIVSAEWEPQRLEGARVVGVSIDEQPNAWGEVLEVKE